MCVRSRDRIKNHGNRHDRNNEFEFKKIYQESMEGESDLVLWKQVHRKWKLNKCQNLGCLPVSEDDDLNATVIEVMTDVEVLLGGNSVIDA